IPTASNPVEVDVPTGSDVVPTASPVFATAMVVTPVTRRKGKEVMVESETPKKQKVQEQIDAQVARELKEQLERKDQRMTKQIARDAKVARIHVEEELQSMIDGLDRSNETVAKDYYMAVIRNNLGWKVKDFKGMTFEEVEAKFNSVWKQIEDFIPMGSTKEAERFKRKGISFAQESAKKQKTSEEVTKEAKSPDEVSEEKVKEMMQLVPIEDVYVEALQVKHPIIDWQDKEIFMLVEKDYPLRKGLALVMICYKLQVENFSQMANDLVLKIYKIANSPRQQASPCIDSFKVHCNPSENCALKSFPPLDNPELTIRRRSRTDQTLLNNSKMAAEGNCDLPVPDLRTMEELCQPSLNGRGGPIALILIVI
nr:hypothetical protein [Tanacetum cinerariifolium]